MVIFLLTLIVCLLFYLVTRREPTNQRSAFSTQVPNLYPRGLTANQQVLISYMTLAKKFNCLPEQVRDRFIQELADKRFTDDDCFKLLATFKVTKQYEAKEFGIPEKYTPSGIMEQWLNEYLVNNYLIK